MINVQEQPYKIPDSWKWTTLGKIANWGSGGTPSRRHKEYFNGDIPWIKTGELKFNYIYDSEEKISLEALNNSSAKIYPKDTVIIAMYAGNNVGNVAILGIEAAVNQACACAVCNSSTYFKYLFYYIIQQKNNLIAKARGSVQENISQEIIKNHSIPLPPVDEQIRIVEIIESLFEKLNRAKSLAQDIVDKYELRRGKITYDAFTGKLTNSTVDDWVNVTLKDVCRINPPKVPTKNLPDELEVTFVPMPSVSAECGTIKEPKTRKLVEVKNGFTNFSEGDVIFAKITPCMENGKSAVVEDLINDIGYGSTEFFVFRCGERLYNRFLYHLVRSKFFRDKARLFMHGSVGQLRVPRSFLESYILKLPPIEEQKEIVHHLDSLLTKEQRTKELAEQTLQKIDLMKKTILARAFRGKL